MSTASLSSPLQGWVTEAGPLSGQAFKSHVTDDDHSWEILQEPGSNFGSSLPSPFWGHVTDISPIHWQSFTGQVTGAIHTSVLSFRGPFPNVLLTPVGPLAWSDQGFWSRLHQQAANADPSLFSPPWCLAWSCRLCPQPAFHLDDYCAVLTCFFSVVWSIAHLSAYAPVTLAPGLQMVRGFQATHSHGSF